MNITELAEPDYHTVDVLPQDRFAVREGDIIAVLYGVDRLGIPYSLCGDLPESQNAYYYRHMTPDEAVVGRVHGFTFYGGAWKCRLLSFRAVVSQVRSL